MKDGPMMDYDEDPLDHNDNVVVLMLHSPPMVVVHHRELDAKETFARAMEVGVLDEGEDRYELDDDDLELMEACEAEVESHLCAAVGA